jgi:hypothetical protein
VLWLGRTLYLWGLIVECLSRTANLIRESDISPFMETVTALSAYQQYPDAEPELPGLRLIQSPENLKSHVVDAD